MDFLLENLGKIGFEWKMALFNLINFLVLFWILKRAFFKPIVKVINERNQKARDAMDNFQKAKTEVSMAERKAQELIDEAKVEANKVVGMATEEAKQFTESMKEKAKEEIARLVEQAKKNIDIDRKEMQDTLRKDTAVLVILAAQQVLGETLDAKKDEAYIQKIITTVEKNA